MRRLAVVALFSACIPGIPERGIEPKAVVPEKLPTVAPCVLVHAEVDENLANGANGWFRGNWKLQYATFVIRRPDGVVLIDAAFGATTNADLDAAPFLFRFNFGSARVAKPLATLLADIGVKPEDVTQVLLTHAHWDHTGGLPQLPNARLVMARAEAEWVLKATGPVVDGAIPSHFAGIRDRVDWLLLQGPAYDGFEGSQDVFGDGTIVAVPTAGHTPGSTSYFVNSGDGHRWLFVGDAAWVKEGFEEPVTKGRLASLLADGDREKTAEVLGRLHALYAAKRATIVTAHDARTWEGIAVCTPVSASKTAG